MIYDFLINIYGLSSAVRHAGHVMTRLLMRGQPRRALDPGRAIPMVTARRRAQPSLRLGALGVDGSRGCCAALDVSVAYDFPCRERCATDAAHGRTKMENVSQKIKNIFL